MSGNRHAEVILTAEALLEWIRPSQEGHWTATTHGVPADAEIVRVWFEPGPLGTGVGARVHVLLASPQFDEIPRFALPPVIHAQWLSMQEYVPTRA